MSELIPHPYQIPSPGIMPNFPEPVRERYAAEMLEYALPTTVEDVLHLTQQHLLGVNPDALVSPVSVRDLKSAKGELIRLLLVNDHKPAKTIQEKAGSYTPIPESDSAPMPKPRAVIEIAEYIKPGYDVTLPATFTGLDKLISTYFVYDAPLSAQDNEPTIYKVINIGSGAPLFIDTEEYTLAEQSDNFHRLTEREAKALAQSLKTAIPVQPSKFSFNN